MTEPIVVSVKQKRGPGGLPIAATGITFDVHEWSGNGPGYLHVHHADDEA